MNKYLVGYFFTGGYGSAVISCNGKITENSIIEFDKMLSERMEKKVNVFSFIKLESEE